MSSLKLVAGFVEGSARELYSQILLAQTFADRGYCFILGSQAAIRHIAPRISPGVFIENGLSIERADRLKMLKHQGWKVVSLCQECYSGNSAKHYADERLHEDSTIYADAIFLLGGKLLEEMIIQRPRLKPLMHVTGNPRFDLLFRPYSRIYNSAALEYITRHGEYVLYNSNFNTIPHKDELLNGVDGLLRAFCPNENTYEARKDLYSSDAKRLQLVTHELEAVSRSLAGSQKLIIRPHPSEDAGFWHAFVKGRNLVNACVCTEDDVRGWILGAKSVLHSQCMTGVEAALLGVPTYSIDQHPCDAHYFNLPNTISRCYVSFYHEQFNNSVAQKPLDVRAIVRKYIWLPEPNQNSTTSAQLIVRATSSIEGQISYAKEDLMRNAVNAMSCFVQPRDALTKQYLPKLDIELVQSVSRALATAGGIRNHPCIYQIGDHCLAFSCY